MYQSGPLASSEINRSGVQPRIGQSELRICGGHLAKCLTETSEAPAVQYTRKSVCLRDKVRLPVQYHFWRQ